MAEGKRKKEKDEAESWWDSLTLEEKRERAMRHQGGENPVRILKPAPKERRG